MSIVNTTNYSGDSPTMEWATQDSDQFNRTHVANTAQVVEQHRHGGTVRGDGLSVLNLNTATALAQDGDVLIATTATWQGTDGLPHSAATLDGSQTFTGTASFTAAVTATSTVDLSGASSFKVPVSAGAAPTVNGQLAYDSTAGAYKGGSAGQTLVLSSAPSGALMAFAAGTTDPTGWFLADGRSLSQVTYATLFGVIGTSYGSAGAGLFNIPDLRSRAIMGADNMGTSAGAAGRAAVNVALGNTSGEDSHVLVTAELASHAHTDSGHTHANTFNDTNHTHVNVFNDTSHNHGITDPQHLHGTLISNGTGGGTQAPGTGPVSTTFQNTSSSATGISLATATTGASVTNAAASTGASVTNASAASNIQTTGSGTAHNNRQLVQICNWIVKQ